MTIDELVRAFDKAYCEKLDDVEATRAGIRAVVTAIREAAQLRPGGCEQCKHNLIVLHEILASDGVVKAAGASARKDEGEGVSKDAHKAASPVADLDVCEWVRISEEGYLTHYLTPHGVTNDFYRWHPYNECSFCGKPISLKSDAAR